MYQVIVNGTEKFECSSFEEQFDALSQNQTQTLQMTNKEVAQDFMTSWSEIAKSNPIKSIEIQYNGQTIISYTHYNMVQFVTVRPLPESAVLEGVVTLVHREIE